MASLPLLPLHTSGWPFYKLPMILQRQKFSPKRSTDTCTRGRMPPTSLTRLATRTESYPLMTALNSESSSDRSIRSTRRSSDFTAITQQHVRLRRLGRIKDRLAREEFDRRKNPLSVAGDTVKRQVAEAAGWVYWSLPPTPPTIPSYLNCSGISFVRTTPLGEPRLAIRFWRTSLTAEYTSGTEDAFWRVCRRFCKSLLSCEVEPSARCARHYT